MSCQGKQDKAEKEAFLSQVQHISKNQCQTIYNWIHTEEY